MEIGQYQEGEDTDLGQLPMLRHFEDQRSCPRVDLRTAVTLVTEDHQVLTVRSRNISADGLQLRSDRETAAALHPRGTHIAPGAGPVLTLRMELPIRGSSKAINAQARLIYIATRSRNEFAFGAAFTKLKLNDKATLADFIMESMRPAAM